MLQQKKKIANPKKKYMIQCYPIREKSGNIFFRDNNYLFFLFQRKIDILKKNDLFFEVFLKVIFLHFILP